MNQRPSDLPERSVSRSADRPRRGADSLEQGLERLVSAGRQLVDGVAGTRPGSRGAGRGGGASGGERSRLGDLGRWVENKLDWILEEEDAWQEPWEQRARPPAQQPVQPAQTSRRRPLEAISRRSPDSGRPLDWGRPLDTGHGPADGKGDGDWPDDDSFSRPRWRRPAPEPLPTGSPTASPADAPIAAPAIAPEAASRGRPLPRSSRRRQP